MKHLKKLTCNECKASFEHKQRLEHRMNKVHLNVKPYARGESSDHLLFLNLYKTWLK
jgi:hypothetical protein